MPTRTQSYICEDCGGTGRNGREAGMTDLYATGEQQWRGYYPTNLCYACNGAGIWGMPQETEPEKVEAKPPKRADLPSLEEQICGSRTDWEDRRDRI
jgi:hypothetical protein